VPEKVNTYQFISSCLIAATKSIYDFSFSYTYVYVVYLKNM